ncbi:hypothetical protein IEQ34_003795 [Dendrobium chrysotoxum]|uniref:Uncharacterized protein n=1 Tax=Dendrobium chrysotoxum TaxID=161865 RepID=A0AAV7HCF6_DENCH|nr:hypothetical protein IEQ34_003795 [Dendrobium chrysotoxum]
MAVRRVSDPDFLIGLFKSRSFVDALYGSPSSGCFPELRHCSFRGLPSLWISKEEIMALSIPFQFALAGFFPTRRPSLDVILKFFFNLKLNAELLTKEKREANDRSYALCGPTHSYSQTKHRYRFAR